MIAVVMLSVVFKKSIHEFKVASLFLFISIMLFIVVFGYQLASVGTDANYDPNFSQYYKFRFDR